MTRKAEAQPSQILTEVAGWLKSEVDAKKLARLELTAKIHLGLVDRTLIRTAHDGTISFPALPSELDQKVASLLKDKAASNPRGGTVHFMASYRSGDMDVKLSLTTEEDERRQEIDRARTARQNVFDQTPFGNDFANRVADHLDEKGVIGMTVDPKEGVDRAFWRRADGTYHYGELWGNGSFESPELSFRDRHEFVIWLAARSDDDFAKEKKTDARSWGLNSFSRNEIQAIIRRSSRQ